MRLYIVAAIAFSFFAPYCNAQGNHCYAPEAEDHKALELESGTILPRQFILSEAPTRALFSLPEDRLLEWTGEYYPRYKTHSYWKHNADGVYIHFGTGLSGMQIKLSRSENGYSGTATPYMDYRPPGRSHEYAINLPEIKCTLSAHRSN